MIISAMTYIACWTLYIIIIFIAYYIYIYFTYYIENIEWIMKNFLFLKNENEEKNYS